MTLISTLQKDQDRTATNEGMLDSNNEASQETRSPTTLVEGPMKNHVHAPEVSYESLPMEILVQVAEYLESRSFGNFRLVSHLNDAVGLEVLKIGLLNSGVKRTVVVTPDAKSLRTCSMLARCNLQHLVTKVKFEVDTLKGVPHLEPSDADLANFSHNFGRFQNIQAIHVNARVKGLEIISNYLFDHEIGSGNGHTGVQPPQLRLYVGSPALRPMKLWTWPAGAVAASRLDCWPPRGWWLETLSEISPAMETLTLRVFNMTVRCFSGSSPTRSMKQDSNDARHAADPRHVRPPSDYFEFFYNIVCRYNPHWPDASESTSSETNRVKRIEIRGLEWLYSRSLRPQSIFSGSSHRLSYQVSSKPPPLKKLILINVELHGPGFLRACKEVGPQLHFFKASHILHNAERLSKSACPFRGDVFLDDNATYGFIKYFPNIRQLQIEICLKFADCWPGTLHVLPEYTDSDHTTRRKCSKGTCDWEILDVGEHFLRYLKPQLEVGATSAPRQDRDE